MAGFDLLIPLPLGERWLGEAESVRGISPLSLTHPPHPNRIRKSEFGELRATFSPRGRRIEDSVLMENSHGTA